ncbi:hypothetical protein CNR22_00205 [Sphingobacteriaceae bacterium]|nr:hypothetical protein CNR22_00205 [Sphingobacteriaceae bacterium]
MGLFIIIILLFLYLIHFKYNHADGQNRQIIDLLKTKQAQQQEKTLCKFSNMLIWTTNQFDIYDTKKSIVLVKSINNFVNQKNLMKRAENYLIIIEKEDMPLELFTNYIVPETILENNGEKTIEGTIHCKTIFFPRKFISSGKIKIKFNWQSHSDIR